MDRTIFLKLVAPLWLAHEARHEISSEYPPHLKRLLPLRGLHDAGLLDVAVGVHRAEEGVAEVHRGLGGHLLDRGGEGVLKKKNKRGSNEIRNIFQK